MTKPRLVITGISGFVGSNLHRYLRDRHGVIGVSRNAAGGLQSYERFFSANMSFDAVVHLAGKAHDLRKVASEREYHEANVELTKKVYDRFLQSPAKTFIYLSSVKAAGDVAETALTENCVAMPSTIYGQSKKMAEDYLLARLPADKNVFVLRPCMIHGPGNKGNLNLLYNVVARGLPYPLAAFDNRRSFLSVENLCFVIARLLEQEIPSGIYNIADDGELSTRRLVELIAASLDKKASILRVPKSLVRIAAGAGDALGLPFNRERLHKLTENYVVDNSKIRNALQCELPVSMADGLMKTFLSFKQ